MGWARAFLANIDTFAGPIVTLLYPLFCSIKAIESPLKLDDKQWLTYWILYSVVTFMELSLWQILHWFPFWGKIKLVLACWLVLPQFNGAAFMYDYFVKKRLFKGQHEKEETLIKRLLKPSTQTLVQKYIDIYGEDAFRNLMTHEIRNH